MSKKTEPEKSYREQIAKELRSCRKVSREWAIWYQKYNTMLMYYTAGLVSIKALKDLLDEGERKGWVARRLKNENIS